MGNSDITCIRKLLMVSNVHYKNDVKLHKVYVQPPVFLQEVPNEAFSIIEKITQLVVGDPPCQKLT